VRVIVAIEPRSYREAIGENVRALRPRIEVYIIDPEVLERWVGRLDPELIFAHQPNILTSTGRSAWVEFRPYEDPAARVCLGGRQWELEEVDLEDLLSLVDQTEALARTRNNLGDC
jgi:hypothetical protein